MFDFLKNPPEQYTVSHTEIFWSYFFSLTTSTSLRPNQYEITLIVERVFYKTVLVRKVSVIRSYKPKYFSRHRKPFSSGSVPFDIITLFICVRNRLNYLIMYCITNSLHAMIWTLICLCICTKNCQQRTIWNQQEDRETTRYAHCWGPECSDPRNHYRFPLIYARPLAETYEIYSVLY